MLNTTKNLIEKFENMNEEQRREFLKDISVEEAEILHDNGYDIILDADKGFIGYSESEKIS